MAHSQEVIVFSDVDADGLYAVTSRARITTEAPATDADGHVRAHQVQVTLDGAGTAVAEVSAVLRDGTTKVLQGGNVGFVLNQGFLIGTHTPDAGPARWEIFRDDNHDGLFTEVANGAGDVVDLTAVATVIEPNIDLL